MNLPLRNLAVAACAAAAVIAAVHDAVAQKAKDTMRAPIVDNLGVVSRYYTFAPENSFIADGAYDGLLYYDEKRQSFQPLLAKSVTQVDPVNYDIQLNENIKWHDGEKFDADDVAYWFNWLIAPDNKLRNRPVLIWMKSIEKTGPYSVRVTSQEPTAGARMAFAYLQPIEPKHIHEKLSPENKADLGWNPVGTGPFKLVRVEKFKGITALANEDYKHGGDWKPAAKVKRWEFVAMPDRSVQVAQMLAGNLDYIRPDTQDAANMLMQSGRFEMLVTQSLGFTYLMIDAAGRTPNSPFRDVRVRKALAAAIDRSQLLLLTGSAATIKQPEAMCWRSMEGCDFSKPFAKYDPAEAKRLLAEAGFANGLKVDLYVLEGKPRPIGEAMGDMLRKVGIDATIHPIVNSIYGKMQGAGELGLYLGIWSGAGVPDVSRTMDQFFAASPRNYNEDPELDRLTRLVAVTQDPVTRKGYARAAFDISNEQAYLLPIIANDIPFLHTKEVWIDPDLVDAYGAIMSHIYWK